MFTILKALWRWLFGDQVRTWRAALWASGLAACVLMRPLIETWAQELYLELPDFMASLLEPLVPYFNMANHFVPLQEALVAFSAYSTWRTLLMLMKLIRWLMPF